MRRAGRGGIVKLILSDDLDRDHISSPSTSNPSSPYSVGVGPKSISDFSVEVSPANNRRNRQRVPKNRHGRRVGKEFDLETPMEAGVSSLRIDEDEKSCDNCERVLEDSEAETSKVSNGYEQFDIMERFLELSFGAQELELCEDHIRINSQAQEDELLAMEYIYPDSVMKLDRQMGLQYFEVHIDIEIPDGITIKTKLASTNDDKTPGNEIMEDFLYSFEVNYIPPMVLTCLLPSSYPSHKPPYFILSVQWLDTKKVSSLCSMLDSIWMEQSGQEIIYHWVEWLSSTSLSYLGFEKEIILGPYNTRHIGDLRAVSGSVSPDVDIPFIKRYNVERQHENFKMISHECCICYSEYPGSEFVRLPCQHYFCWKCMKTFSDMHVSEGTVTKLLCPEPKCDGTVPPSLLKSLLSEEEYDRWESLTLQKTLDSMEDIVYCPRCETPCIEEEDQHAQCTICFFSFCTLCKDRRHVGGDCLAPESNLALLQDRQNMKHLKAEQRRREQQMIEEIISVKAILRDAKQCPSCKMAISRTEGCNKMVCKNCGKFFCYRCNKKINGYDHYSDGTCELFPREMVHLWEAERQLEAEARAEILGDEGPGLRCPTCGQFNSKFNNNNHLFCWGCLTHYCYLCKKIVRRTTQHFGKNGCKQRSED